MELKMSLHADLGLILKAGWVANKLLDKWGLGDWLFYRVRNFIIRFTTNHVDMFTYQAETCIMPCFVQSWHLTQSVISVIVSWDTFQRFYWISSSSHHKDILVEKICHAKFFFIHSSVRHFLSSKWATGGVYWKHTTLILPIFYLKNLYFPT